MRRRAILSLAALVSLGASSGLSISAGRTSTAQASPFLTPISNDQKIFHALNRLTFGPRPGDFDEVRKLGIKKWIDLELHPDRVPENPALENKLAPLDTLRMTSAELARNYPTPQMIKAMVEGKIPYPSDPEKRMMIENAVRRFKQQQGQDGAQKPALDNVGLTEEQQRILRRGTPEEKLKVFDGLLDVQKDEVLAALPPAVRIQLFSAAPPDLRRRIQKSGGPQAVITQDLTEGKLLRAIYSHRQLEEVLTDFWYNHFNVFLDKGADRYLVTPYERDVIRPHVLGKFKDLLMATAESPAMLFYLDNFQSVDPRVDERIPSRRGAQPKIRRGLNENYARELMELHTLGVDGGYTQRDVTEVARCFTGWSIREPQQGGGFEFRERLHDNGPKVVLGVKIPLGGGIDDGLKVLDILAHHPSTARFISKKLAMRFVADNPPPSLIDKMARTFHHKDGDLRAVMETMFGAPEFWSQGAYHAKLKSPLEMVASAVRALDADVDFSFALSQQLTQLGEPLYRKQEPTGYTNAGQEWVNSAALLARMNFAIALAANRIPGVKVDAARFAEDQDTDQMARALMLTDLSGEARAAIDAALNAQTNPSAATGQAQRTGSAQPDTDGGRRAVRRVDPQPGDNTQPGTTPEDVGGGAKRRPMPAMGLLPPQPVPRPLVIAGLMLGSPDFQRR
jgi:uncharacterized protein (DUF1800 family)